MLIITSLLNKQFQACVHIVNTSTSCGTLYQCREEAPCLGPAVAGTAVSPSPAVGAGPQSHV